MSKKGRKKTEAYSNILKRIIHQEWWNEEEEEEECPHFATHLLLSNNPTKDQNLCQKIRLKTKVEGGGGMGTPP